MKHPRATRRVGASKAHLAGPIARFPTTQIADAHEVPSNLPLLAPAPVDEDLLTAYALSGIPADIDAVKRALYSMPPTLWNCRTARAWGGASSCAFIEQESGVACPHRGYALAVIEWCRTQRQFHTAAYTRKELQAGEARGYALLALTGLGGDSALVGWCETMLACGASPWEPSVEALLRNENSLALLWAHHVADAPGQHVIPIPATAWSENSWASGGAARVRNNRLGTVVPNPYTRLIPEHTHLYTSEPLTAITRNRLRGALERRAGKGA